MKITTVYKGGDGSPLEGLTPLISIRDITVMTVPVAIVTAVPMIDMGAGFYGYEFAGYVNGKEYSVYIDADDAISARYQYSTIDKYDLANLEGNLDFGQMMRVMYAVLANKSLGGGSSVVTFRDIANSKNRISATVDPNGNRSLVTVDPN